MDRRSWLWRRKSSEKNPSGETESSGSLSSLSERFSDDQTASNLNTQSPEVTSKAAADDELNDNFKTLSEKLTEALLNIRAKEDLVKQHAKVAEEAVSGWERAENEVLVLKKQLDALTQKKLILEERVGHLEGALKECLRQLRQTREDQEEKIQDAVSKEKSEWESKNSELQNQLVDLRAQLQNLKSDNTVLADTRSKLEAAEKENSILEFNLLSKDQELKLKTSERDLSTRAAENASKQHLDSIKKVTKLEAECLRLKAMARKAAAAALANNDHSSVAENDNQSIDSEPCHSDSWASATVTEAGQFKLEKNLNRIPIGPAVEIDLMDDFLEMERLAAFPETHSATNVASEETDLQDELEAMTKRTTELEDNLKKITAEKLNLETALSECQIALGSSKEQLKQTEAKLLDLNAQVANAQKEVECTKMELMNSTKVLGEAEIKLAQLQDQLKQTNKSKSKIEVELQDANLKKERAESRLKTVELELENLRSRTRALGKEVEEERNLAREAESQLEMMEQDLETMRSSICTLETEVDEERNISREYAAKCETLEAEISKLKLDSETMCSSICALEKDVDKERNISSEYAARCETLEYEISKVELVSETLRSGVCALEKEVDKERNFSREYAAKCDMLESVISEMKSDPRYQRSAAIQEFRIDQDKELAVAAYKFAECQKTIASLGRQLKSLATFEDFQFDSERPLAC